MHSGGDIVFEHEHDVVVEAGWRSMGEPSVANRPVHALPGVSRIDETPAEDECHRTEHPDESGRHLFEEREAWESGRASVGGHCGFDHAAGVPGRSVV